MAKRKSKEGGVNKSQAIREILTSDPHKPTKDVIAALAGKGIKVIPSQVYFIKGKMQHKKRKDIGIRMEKAGLAHPVDLILQVKSLANAAGGMAKLKQLVDALAE